MNEQQAIMRQVIDKFMKSLPARDWKAMKETLAPDVMREGPEGQDGDALMGADAYIEWLSGMADPLHEYGWRTDRLIYGDDGRSAVVEATTRYLITPDSEPFGYHLVMLFEFDDLNRIADVDLYWKTPKKRLRGDTVTGGS
jgi:hypothetical protein